MKPKSAKSVRQYRKTVAIVEPAQTQACHLRLSLVKYAAVTKKQVHWICNIPKFRRFDLANTKSAIKRIRQNEKRREHNRIYRGYARTSVKKARMVIESGDVDAARAATMEAVSALDKAAQKGILHNNNASRRKGRLMKQLAALEQQA
jgi:small subunit ribosomal protein S20